MKNKEVLEEMFKIYGKPTIDWMGFKVTKNNFITYHHISENRNGGEESANNGALLTIEAHSLLNLAEVYNHPLYDEYQYWFRIINDMKRKPTNEVMNTMYTLKSRLKKGLKENCLKSR